MAWSLPGSPWHGMVATSLTSAWHICCQAHLGMAKQRHSSFKVIYPAQTAFIASVPEMDIKHLAVLSPASLFTLPLFLQQRTSK